jgi:hypothetical protein
MRIVLPHRAPDLRQVASLGDDLNALFPIEQQLQTTTHQGVMVCQHHPNRAVRRSHRSVHRGAVCQKTQVCHARSCQTVAPTCAIAVAGAATPSPCNTTFSALVFAASANTS